MQDFAGDVPDEDGCEFALAKFDEGFEVAVAGSGGVHGEQFEPGLGRIGFAQAVNSYGRREAQIASAENGPDWINLSFAETGHLPSSQPVAPR